LRLILNFEVQKTLAGSGILLDFKFVKYTKTTIFGPVLKLQTTTKSELVRNFETVKSIWIRIWSLILKL
jgi:hypothetical protein